MQAKAKAEAEQKRLEDDLERRKNERQEKVATYLEDVMRRGVGAGGMASLNRFEERLKDEEAEVALEIERQKEVVKEAAEFVEQKRREMAEAAKELKAIEKHKEKWQTEVRKERQAKEELNQEEIGNTLFLMRQRK
jgi:flagellar export protein FliJ